MNVMITLHTMKGKKMMNDNEILKYLLRCLKATTKEEKEKISQECWEKALDKANPM